MIIKFIKKKEDNLLLKNNDILIKTMHVADGIIVYNKDFKDRYDDHTHFAEFDFNDLPTDATHIVYEFKTKDEKNFRINFWIKYRIPQVYGNNVTMKLFLVSDQVKEFFG